VKIENSLPVNTVVAIFPLISFFVGYLKKRGARGSVVVKASRKVAGSSPDEVDFFKLT
jgi:hypothetical protein